MAVTSGQQVGEYVLEAKIGQGAFGEVWRARHHVWRDNLVAVKIPTDPAFVSSLQREGISIHGLSHPNIVRAINFDPYALPPYLVMEYVGGPSLRQVLSTRGPLAADEATAILRQILAALAYAHARGVTHRDVKPENILLAEHAARDGFKLPDSVKLADFGLGQQATAAAAQSIAFSATFSGSQGAKIAGTLDYMAPEQREPGGTVDGRADLYACGVVLYEMLTGVRPAGLELPSARNAKVPARLDEAFQKAYARIDRRFASAEEFLAFLSAPVSKHAEPVVTAAPPQPVPPPPKPAASNAYVPPPPPARPPRNFAPMIKGILLLGLIIGGIVGGTKALRWYNLHSQSYDGSWRAYHMWVKDEAGGFSGSARVVAVSGEQVLLAVKGDLGFPALVKARNAGASLCVSGYTLSLRFAGGEVRMATWFAPVDQTVPSDEITFYLCVNAASDTGGARLTPGVHFEVEPTAAKPARWYAADKVGVAQYIANAYRIATTTN
jgi:serine/threonine protein kinase